MCVDTVGSTALAQRLDPEDIHAVLDGALAAFTQIVHAQRGRVLQYTGDGLIAAFCTDAADDDDTRAAVRAVHAGLAIVDAAALLSARVQEQHRIAGFEVRVGLARGEVLLGSGVGAEGSVRGAAVLQAARMEHSAPPGGLRLHADMAPQVQAAFELVAEALAPAPGSEAPETSYLVRRPGPTAANAP